MEIKDHYTCLKNHNAAISVVNSLQCVVSEGFERKAHVFGNGSSLPRFFQFWVLYRVSLRSYIFRGRWGGSVGSLNVFACPFLLLLVPHLELVPPDSPACFVSFSCWFSSWSWPRPPPAFSHEERAPVKSVSKVKLPSWECTLLWFPGSPSADCGGVWNKLLEQLTKA